MSIAEKLTVVAENEQKVFDAGYNRGFPEGYKEGEEIGYTNGSDAGYIIGYEEGYQYGKEAGVNDSVRWDVIQDYGNRLYYNNAFAYWNMSTLMPKYTIAPTSTFFMSAFQGCISLEYINWEMFDLSNCGSFNKTFNSCYKLISIDIDLAPTLSNANVWDYAFSGCRALTKIQKITAQATHAWTGAFNRCDALTDITFDGVIANSINFQHSPLLSYDSIQSIIRALSTTATGNTITLSKTAVNNAYNMDVDDETVWEDDMNEMATWVKYYSNWTFSLV